MIVFFETEPDARIDAQDFLELQRSRRLKWSLACNDLADELCGTAAAPGELGVRDTVFRKAFLQDRSWRDGVVRPVLGLFHHGCILSQARFGLETRKFLISLPSDEADTNRIQHLQP